MLGEPPTLAESADKTVVMTYDTERARYMVTAAYDEDLVEVLKSIDHQSREYDAGTKRWYVDPWARDFLTGQMEMLGFHVTDHDQDLAASRTVSFRDVHSWLVSYSVEWAAGQVTAKQFARAGCALGFRLILLEPGTGNPVDLRTDRQRREDDGEAMDRARMAGHDHWDKSRSRSGVHLATRDPLKLSRYIDMFVRRYGSEPGVDDFAITL